MVILVTIYFDGVKEAQDPSQQTQKMTQNPGEISRSGQTPVQCVQEPEETSLTL